MTPTRAVENARWQVLWVADKRVVRKDFGPDLSRATEVYAKAVAAGKRAATLRCCNVGFAPPIKLQPHDVFVVKKVKRNGRIKRVKIPKLVLPLDKLNREQGVWWCPYCMKLRKFIKRKGYRLDNVWVEDVHHACPMCNVSHRDFHVRRWNPVAVIIDMEQPARK